MSQQPKKVYRRRRILIDEDATAAAVAAEEDNVRAPDPVVREQLIGGGMMHSTTVPPPPPLDDFMKTIEISRREAEEKEMRAAMELIAAMEASERIEREKGKRVAIGDAIMAKLARLSALGDVTVKAVYCMLDPIMNEYKLWGSTRPFDEDEKQQLAAIVKTVRFTAEEKEVLSFLIANNNDAKK